MARKTRDTEYAVNRMDEHDNIVEQDLFTSVIDAQRAFDEAEAPAELERWDNVWEHMSEDNVSLWDRTFTTIRSKT